MLTTPGGRSACWQTSAKRSAVSGVVLARNEAVLSSPEELQNDPYGEGWLLLVRPSEPAQLQGLMDAATYSAKVDGH